MGAIIIATLVVGSVGLLIGVALVFAGEKFRVDIDQREILVRGYLPGNNCGGCGYPGCDGMAAAIVKGEAPANGCPVNNKENNSKIAGIMGVEIGEIAKMVAFVKCAGDCEHTSQKCNYVGIKDCRAAMLAGLPVWECDYGCLGYGSCVEACEFQAIQVHNGVAVVDTDACAGCGACTKVCPKGLIELIPADKKVAVACSNHDKGAEVKKVCTAGCIGCSLCTKQCEAEAIQVDGFLAHIDYEKCTGCGKCKEKCPSKIIKSLEKAENEEV